MSAFTTKAPGDWSSGGQTTWNEVGVPGDGDTVTIDHDVNVDVNTTVGESPGDQTTYGVAVAHTKTLTIAEDVTFTVKTNISIIGGGAVGQFAALTLEAGSSLIFDGTGASNQEYTIYGNVKPLLTVEGVVGNRCTIAGVSAVARGRVNLVGAGGNQVISYCDFQYLGSGAAWGGGVDFQPGAGGDLTVENCTFDDVDGVRFKQAVATENLIVTDNVFTNSGKETWLSTNSASTATNTISGNVFDKVLHARPIHDGTFANNIMLAKIEQAAANWGTTVPTNCLIRTTGTGWSIFTDLTDCFALADHTSSPHWISMKADNLTFDGLIFEFSGNRGVLNRGDCVLPDDFATGIIQNCILLPAADDKMAAVLVSLGGDATTTCRIFHNTTAGEVAYYGESYAGHADIIEMGKSNLAWKPSGESGDMYAWRRYAGTEVLDGFGDQDYNWRWNIAAGDNLRGYDSEGDSDDIWTAGNSVDAGMDDNSDEGDPDFVDETRDLGSWGATEGGDGSISDALDILIADTSKIAAMITWIKNGFVVQNSDLETAGHDSTPPGAMGYQASGHPTMRRWGGVPHMTPGPVSAGRSW